MRHPPKKAGQEAEDETIRLAKGPSINHGDIRVFLTPLPFLDSKSKVVIWLTPPLHLSMCFMDAPNAKLPYLNERVIKDVAVADKAHSTIVTYKAWHSGETPSKMKQVYDTIFFTIFNFIFDGV